MTDLVGGMSVCVDWLAARRGESGAGRQLGPVDTREHYNHLPLTTNMSVTYVEDVVYPELDYSAIAENMRDVSKPSPSKSKDSHKQEMVNQQVKEWTSSSYW